MNKELEDFLKMVDEEQVNALLRYDSSPTEYNSGCLDSATRLYRSSKYTALKALLVQKDELDCAGCIRCKAELIHPNCIQMRCGLCGKNYSKDDDLIKEAPQKQTLPEKKRYKLCDMWKVWIKSYDRQLDIYKLVTWICLTKPDIRDIKNVIGIELAELLAITRGEAMEYYDGEGLEER